MNGLLKIAGIGVAGFLAGKWLWGGKKDDAHQQVADGSGGKYPVILGTAVVNTDHGPVRYFDAEVGQTALRNLASVYDAVNPPMGESKPLVGERYARIHRHNDGLAQPGSRAFDWVQQRTQEGLYVLLSAQSGSGPWSQVEGNNYLLAVKPEDIGHKDVIDEWAVVAEPGSLSATLLAMPTAALDHTLSGES
jgi:hypothetical protein